MMDEKRNEVIKNYFSEGYSYKEIVNLLSSVHGVSLSVRQLKRILKSINLSRKNIIPSELEEVLAAILEELQGSGSCLGYKSLWRRLQQVYGLKVYRDTVLDLLHVIDPEGIDARLKHRLHRRHYNVPGPNFLWHVDGYDKLKPFGFAIHGGIDGFSRRILWLEVASSNNKPEIIAHYFLQTIMKLKLIPTMIRSDRGTENCMIESVQQVLRSSHTDKLSGDKSFIQGKSTSNQRIESFWCQMRRQGIDFWIKFFKDLRDCNVFNDSESIHIEVLRYCFGPLINFDLQRIRKEWNCHKIRKQKCHELSVFGRPNCLFYNPEEYNARDYKKNVNFDDVQICMDNFTTEPTIFDPSIGKLIQACKPNTPVPVTIEDALHLFTEVILLIDECKDEDHEM